MQVSLVLAAIGLLASSAHGASSECTKIDPSLVSCPPVEAPRITELAPGSVVVAFTILPNGSVSNARITQSDNTQWNAAAIQMVSQWRYKPVARPIQKVQHLQFGFHS